MTKIFEEILHISREGTFKQQEIAHFLLNNKQYKIGKITDFAKKFSTSVATVSRLSKRLGYNYFKVFARDWNNTSHFFHDHIYQEEFNNKEIGKIIAQQIKKAQKIHIIASYRTRGAALFLKDGLEKMNIDSEIFANYQILKSKLSKKNNLFIFLSLSSSSLTIKKILEKILINFKNDSENQIIYLALKQFEFDEKITNINQLTISHQNWQLNNSNDIFHILVHLVKIFYYIFNYL